MRAGSVAVSVLVCMLAACIYLVGFFSLIFVAICTVVAWTVLTSYLEKPLPVVCNTYTAPGWERVARVFREQVENGAEEGAAFAVYHKGELVVDMCGGYANKETRQPWSKELLSPAFSTTKGAAALVIAKLVDQGLLDYEEAVSTYWPEFAKNGKKDIKLKTLMSHQAGLAILDEPFHVEDIMKDPEKVGRVLSNQKPAWQPGSAIGYHAVSFGLYVDQLVRRVDPKHRGLGQFFQEEIADPFEIDFFIGLPRQENYRCTHAVDKLSLLSTFKERNWVSFKLIGRVILGDQTLMKLISNPAGFEHVPINNPYIREIPSGSSMGFGTASGLAKLFGILANGGSYKGKTLLSRDTISKMLEVQAVGKCRVIALNFTYAMGFNLFKNKLGGNMFGAPGHGGQMAVGDVEHRVSWTYLTNFLRPSILGQDRLYKPLADAVYDVINELEN